MFLANHLRTIHKFPLHNQTFKSVDKYRCSSLKLDSTKHVLSTLSTFGGNARNMRFYSTPNTQDIASKVSTTVDTAPSSLPTIEPIHGDSLITQIMNSESAQLLFDPSHYEKFYDPLLYSVGLTLDSIHLATGLPWWGSILLLSAAARLALTPISKKQIRVGLIIEKIRPLIMSAKEEFTQITETPISRAAALERSREFRMLVKNHFKRYNISQLTSLKLTFPQVGYFLVTFASLNSICSGRSLAQMHESLKTGGTLWFPDLTVVDPTFALPILSIATSVLTILTNPTPNQLSFNKIFLGIILGVSILSLYVTASFPAGLHVLWISSNIMFAISNLYLKTQVPGIRKEVDKLDA